MTVSWFQSLPAGWVARRIKTISPVMRGASPRPIDDPIYFDDDGEYAWVRISDVTASDGLLNSTTQRLSTLGASKSVKLDRGKLFLSIAGSVGKPCISDIKACIHDGFVYFPFLPIESQKFLYWVFVSRECFSGLGKLGTQLNLNTETVGNIAIPFPDLATQRQIADFLDRETARIDLLIEKKQRLVALLGEKYFAELESVTFPENTLADELVPFRWVCRIAEGQVDPTSETWRERILIAPNHIESRTGRLLATQTAAEQGAISGKYAFGEGTVLYSKIRPALAKACLSPSAGMCSADMYPIIPDKRLRPDYLLMQLLSARFTDWATLESMRVAMPKINRETLGAFRLRVPPLEIQDRNIASFAYHRAQFEEATDKINASIDRLKEYRSTLITAAVTGQIDVSTYPKSGPPDRHLDTIQKEMGA